MLHLQRGGVHQLQPPPRCDPYKLVKRAVVLDCLWARLTDLPDDLERLAVTRLCNHDARHPQ